MPNRISMADAFGRGLYGWANQCAEGEMGLDTYQFTGWAKIDTTARNEFDIALPSLKVRVRDKPFIIPNGATVYRIGLRLPRLIRDDEGGKKYALLEKDMQLLGTAGENLKVAATTAGHTAIAPAIVCNGNGTYTPHASAVVAANEWQPLTAPLTTLTADTTFKFYVSNAGNTAAGNGLRVNRGEAFMIAEVCFKMVAEAMSFERAGFPYQPDSSFVR